MIQAVCDIPCAFFAKELIEAFPEAKVILTTRSTEAWHNSMMQTVWALYHDRIRWIAAKLDGPTSRRRRMSDLFFQHFFGHDFPQNGTHVFNAHNNAVRRLVPPGRFLEFRANDGWKPLCTFLGKPIPQDKEYPNTNDIQSFRSRFQAMNKPVFNQVLRSLATKILPLVIISTVVGWKIWGSKHFWGRLEY